MINHIHNHLALHPLNRSSWTYSTFNSSTGTTRNWDSVTHNNNSSTLQSHAFLCMRGYGSVIRSRTLLCTCRHNTRFLITTHNSVLLILSLHATFNTTTADSNHTFCTTILWRCSTDLACKECCITIIHVIASSLPLARAWHMTFDRTKIRNRGESLVHFIMWVMSRVERSYIIVRV